MTIIFDEDKQNQKLRQMKLEEEERLMKMLSQKYDIPYIDLTSISINTDALRLLAEEDARKGECAVFDIVGKKLSVALTNPNNEHVEGLIDGLKRLGYTIVFYISSLVGLTKAWSLYKDLSFAVETEAGALDISDNEIEDIVQKTTSLGDVHTLLGFALAEKKSHRLSRILATIMAGGLATLASDIHIEAEESFSRLRYRLDGVLVEAMQFDLETYRSLLSRLKLLSGLKLNIKENAQDGRFTIRIYTEDVEIRTSTIPGAYGESIVMRILNPKAIASSIEELGMPKKLYDITQHEIGRPNGMILVTGPTGSGKTTTLYAFLKKSASPDFKIVTIEDPIEYHLPGIVQTQVEDARGYTFSAGLRSVVRQDPDIILVGEIRDTETALTAIQASLTGHLVFSTLHTNNAAGTFTRLIDLGVDSKVITSAVHLAIAQRLVRKLCPVCKKMEPVSEKHKKIILDTLASLQGYDEENMFTAVPEVLPHAVGCAECNNTGYKGRIGVYEGILADEKIEETVRMNPSEREISVAAKEQKIMTMKQDGVIKVLQGVTTLDELERVVDVT
ncbi:MAG: type pilus assembly ATPase PilB, type pilus assembly protein PilB [Candidatus Parcubacteria bacterium]|jgi:type IV pilus assembly protein PilB